MANSTHVLPTQAEITELLDAFLVQFRKRTMALQLFSFGFETNSLRGNNKVGVEYYPLDTDPSVDRVANQSLFDLVQDTETQIREVTIDRQKGKAISYSAEDIARRPNLNPVQQGIQKANKLADDVIADIWSVAVAANFPTQAFGAPIAAADFDVNELIDLGATLDTQDWPDTNRGLILNPAYYASLIKDDRSQEFGRSNDPEIFRSAMIQDVAGFGTAKAPGIKANGENVVGAVVHSSAILTAFAPVEPTEDMMQAGITRYEKMEDDYTGLVLEYMRVASGHEMRQADVVIANYGFDVGDENALQLIKSA